MSEPAIEGEVIEEPGEQPDSPGTEMVVAEGGALAPTTLFRTDDPAEIIQRATAVADSLAEVLRTQKGPDGKLRMISNIQGREHVKIEGWTFCGTMLGVFAVPIWTRKLTDPDGWEARAEARTLDGHIVGSADAQCTRDEAQWSYHPKNRYGKDLEPRDDYALRSMAQTRAASKALRLPLGFIMEIAGFATTPAEEMVAESDSAQPQPQRQEGPPPYPVPRSWPDVEKAVKNCDNKVEAWALWEAFLRAAVFHQYGQTSLKEISTAERKVMFQKAATAVLWLHENAPIEGPEFKFFTESLMRQAWATVLDGHTLAIPDYVPPEPPEEQEQIEQMARESFADAEYQ